MTHDQLLAAQRGRAVNLATTRSCPHCARPITLLDALAMVRGHGYRYDVKIILPDGLPMFVEAGDFNPKTMLWGETEYETGASQTQQRSRDGSAPAVIVEPAPPEPPVRVRPDGRQALE